MQPSSHNIPFIDNELIIGKCCPTTRNAKGTVRKFDNQINSMHPKTIDNNFHLIND